MICQRLSPCTCSYSHLGMKHIYLHFGMDCSSTSQFPFRTYHRSILLCIYMWTSYRPYQCIHRHSCMGNFCTHQSLAMVFRSSRFSIPDARRAYRRTCSLWKSIHLCIARKHFQVHFRVHRTVYQSPSQLESMVSGSWLMGWDQSLNPRWIHSRNR